MTCYEPDCGHDGFTGLLGVSAASAVGGSSITIQGFGFHARETYACRFSGVGGASMVSTAVDYLSPRQLVFAVPPWPQEAQNVSLQLLAGRGQRLVRHVKVSVASGSAGSQGALSGSLRYNTSELLLFQYLPEVVAVSEPAWADRLGGRRITLRGAGFHPDRRYLCAIVSNETTRLSFMDSPLGIQISGEDEESQASGLLLALGTITEATNFAYDVHHVVCMPPAFDTVTPFADYRSQKAPVMLYERAPGYSWARQ